VSARADEIKARAEACTGDLVRFLQDLIAIPSESGHEGAVIERIAAEMRACRFDEVRTDPLGNVHGRVGNGARVIAIDGHVDTVGVGDPSTWSRDPYGGDVADGVIYGRGAADQKAGVAAAVYGARIIRDLGLDGDYRVWVTGTVMEEDCDGLCWQYILREGVLWPDVVVITEPTNLGVYRGHRGRMEMEVRVQGLACHGSMPERGVNAIYRMAPIIAGIERLNADLAAGADPVLGKGSVTISDIRSTAPSLCAVADSCTIHLDRRLTRGETLESAVAQIEGLESVRRAGASVRVLTYDAPSYTGVRYATRKYYPTWLMDEDHPAVEAALRAAEQALERRPETGHWAFSTNGIATCGLFGVPTVGFGPGHEIHAHAPDEQVPVAHLTLAARFYAAFPRAYVEAVGDRLD